MNTLTLSYDNDYYEIQYVLLSILVLKRNRRLIKFSDCPDDVQEAIVKHLEDSVIAKTNSPFIK